MKRVSDMRDERARRRDVDEEDGVGLGLGDVDLFRRRASRLRRAWKAIHGAEERMWCRVCAR